MVPQVSRGGITEPRALWGDGGEGRGRERWGWGTCSLDLWAGAPSCLGIPEQREGPVLRAGALLHLVTAHYVSLASHCPTVDLSLSVWAVEEALNQIVGHISASVTRTPRDPPCWHSRGAEGHS